MKLSLAVLALLLIAPRADARGEPQISQFDQAIVRRDGILAQVAPYWNELCDLVDAILDDRKRGVYLEQHRALAERFPSSDHFGYLADKWKPRVQTIPRNIKQLDWEKVTLEFFESQAGNSIVVVQREPGSQRILRIKGVFSGKELTDFNIVTGTRVMAPVASMEGQRTWRR